MSSALKDMAQELSRQQQQQSAEMAKRWPRVQTTMVWQGEELQGEAMFIPGAFARDKDGRYWRLKVDGSMQAVDARDVPPDVMRRTTP